tara:strand:- start:4588 stop:4866 length:279 start_codon:yes stop_codon:yes gene_type:complete
MEFDFKITTWERVTVKEENEQEVLQAIKNGKIESANDIYDFLADKGDINIECEKLTQVDEQMSVDDNDGASTIEVLDSAGNSIFSNGTENFM